MRGSRYQPASSRAMKSEGIISPDIGRQIDQGGWQARPDDQARGAAMAAEWYFKVMGTVFGPVSVTELVQQAAEGRIAPDTEVKKGDGPWVLASKVAGLFDRAAQAKPTVLNPPSPPMTSDGA